MSDGGREQPSPDQPSPDQPGRDQPGRGQRARNAADRADRAKRAREALAVVKADALARGNFPARAARAPAPGTSAGAGGERRERRDDPQALNSAIDGLISEHGWQQAAATGALFGHWAQIVGPELADHTRPETLADGELTVTADSTAWATQLRLLAGQLVHRLNVELGDGAVRRVKVRGPASAQRRPGEWRVRGGRGPRDTYG